MNYKYKDSTIAYEEFNCVIDTPALTKEIRDTIQPDFIIWMDTVERDYTTLELPEEADIMIESFDYSVDAVIGRIMEGFM